MFFPLISNILLEFAALRSTPALIRSIPQHSSHVRQPKHTKILFFLNKAHSVIKISSRKLGAPKYRRNDECHISESHKKRLLELQSPILTIFHANNGVPYTDGHPNMHSQEQGTAFTLFVKSTRRSSIINPDDFS